MNEKEVKERLEDLIDTCNKGIEMHPYDKELFETDREAIGTVLQLLEQKDKRIDELEKALVEEAIKSTEKINKVIAYIKDNMKEHQHDNYDITLHYSLDQEECENILKILEE